MLLIKNKRAVLEKGQKPRVVRKFLLGVVCGFSKGLE